MKPTHECLEDLKAEIRETGLECKEGRRRKQLSIPSSDNDGRATGVKVVSIQPSSRRPDESDFTGIQTSKNPPPT